MPLETRNSSRKRGGKGTENSAAVMVDHNHAELKVKGSPKVRKGAAVAKKFTGKQSTKVVGGLKTQGASPASKPQAVKGASRSTAHFEEGDEEVSFEVEVPPDDQFASEGEMETSSGSDDKAEPEVSYNSQFEENKLSSQDSRGRSGRSCSLTHSRSRSS